MPRRDGDWEGSAGGWLTERCMPGSRSVEKPSGRRVSSASESAGFALGSAGGLDAGQLAAAHLVVDDVAVDLGEQGVVAAPADTGAWVDAGAALPYEDGAGGHPLSSVALDPEPLGGRVAAVAAGRSTLLVGHLSSPRPASRASCRRGRPASTRRPSPRPPWAWCPRPRPWRRPWLRRCGRSSPWRRSPWPRRPSPCHQRPWPWTPWPWTPWPCTPWPWTPLPWPWPRRPWRRRGWASPSRRRPCPWRRGWSSSPWRRPWPRLAGR